jgi:hypothetical protein
MIAKWYARQDSNLRSSAPEADALSPGPQAHASENRKFDLISQGVKGVFMDIIAQCRLTFNPQGVKGLLGLPDNIEGPGDTDSRVRQSGLKCIIYGGAHIRNDLSVPAQ